MITCQIEKPDYAELLGYMHYQIADAFPLLRGEARILAFTDKLYTHADFCFCRDDGRLVGMIAYYANGRGANFAYIAQGYVSSGYRQAGLYTRMLNEVTNDVKNKGFHEIRLEVVSQNDRSLSCHLRNGFKIMDSDMPNVQSYFLNKTI